MSKKQNSSLNKVIWMSVLALFVCVCCTTYVWADRMEVYLQDDTNAIALTPVDLNDDELKNVEVVSVNQNDPVESSKNARVKYQEMRAREGYVAGVEVSDDTAVWSMKTQVEIFKISYVNGENEVTVHSDGEDKLIAPGTENSYTFKLKNTGNTMAHYELNVEAYISPDGVDIPVDVRLSREDGLWLTGDLNEFVDVLNLNDVYDRDDLKPGRVVSYTLDWMWPFESERDDLDTLLGNRAVDEDLTLTIVINTLATVDPAPNTGDDSSLGLWLGLTCASFVLLIILILIKKKREDDADED